MNSKTIHGYKQHQPCTIVLPARDTFKVPKTYKPIDDSRIVGFDTESFHSREYGAQFDEKTQLWRNGLRTISVQLYAKEWKTILYTLHDEYPLLKVLNTLFPIYAVKEERPSRTRQRNRRVRSDGKVTRDGRRQYVPPVLLVAHNLEYDYARLVRNHPSFARALRIGDTSVRFQFFDYEIELAENMPYGNTPHFEWYVRKDKHIMRIIGRDSFSYLKTSLANAALALQLRAQKDERMPVFHLAYEELTHEQQEWLYRYALKDAEVVREVYRALMRLLRGIDEHVITKSGLLPKSAPGAAARIAFSKACVPEWPCPPVWAQEMGSLAYAGARCFCRKPDYYDKVSIYDISSAYPYVMAQLPDPATCAYIKIENAKFRIEQFKGKWGVLCISGYSNDKYYPALRVHDTKNKRLQYVYGEFDKIWATIPEIVIGVVSNRLQVDYIYEGCVLVGDNKKSFLRLFVEELYDIKNSTSKDNPLHVLAKLLLNSLYGKLIETHITKHTLETDVALSEVPTYEDEHIQQQCLATILKAYLESGYDGMLETIEDFVEQYPPTKTKLLNDILPKAKVYAGNYYLAMHAANVTGFVSAQLGLAAHYTRAVAGHTDSLFVESYIPDDTRERFRLYQLKMREAGYTVPLFEHNLGSFVEEITDAYGIVVKHNLYYLEYKGKNGELLRKYAHHGLPHVDIEQLPLLLSTFLRTGKLHYETKQHPTRLRQTARVEKEAGEFVVEQRKFAPNEYEALERINGEYVWKAYKSE